MSATPPLAQVIGRAENALGALMTGVLARTGGTFPQWVALNLATAPGDLATKLADSLKLETPATATVIAQLHEAGWLEPGSATLTQAGRQRHAQIRAAVGQATAGLFDDLPAADVATVARVLTTITDRANARLAS